MLACSLIAMTALGAMHAHAGPASRVKFDTEPFGNLSLPEKKPGQRWLWVNDYQNGLYGRSILVDVDSGATLGQVDMGWENIKLDIPSKGEQFYGHGLFMSRGFRGERTDVVQVFNRRTFVVEKEIALPAKAIRGWPDPNHSALSDDDRFMFVQFFTPASSIGVIDLAAGKFVGEIETTGCAHVMAAGKRRFFTLCGDGALTAVTLDDNGREAGRKRYPAFFDADADPLHGGGMRAGDTWYFASWNGMVHPLDVAGEELKFGQPWPVTAKFGKTTWVPGPPITPVYLHAQSKTLFALMHPKDETPKGGGTDFHRAEGTEVWAFDLATQKRKRRIKLAEPTYTIAVSADAKPLLYSASILSRYLHVYEAGTGKPLKKLVKSWQMPILMQPVK